TAASGFALIEHLLETFYSAKVRIGDFSSAAPTAVVFGQELHQQADFVAHSGRTHLSERGDVLVVHRDQKVEALEVGCADLPTTQPGEFVAALSGCLLRAFV